MGSCVSVHKDPESAMRVRFSIGSKNEKLMIPSPVKEKPFTVNAGDRTAVDMAVSSLRSPARYNSLGSKDEAFFDSQPWLESDCEDDFVSVNGDFSSSRGNTPVHPTSSLGKPIVNKLPLEEAKGSIPDQPSPPDKKKRLSDLFKESLRNDDYNDEEKSVSDKEALSKVVAEAEAKAKVTTLAQQLKSTNGSPNFSQANSDGSSERTTPNGVLGGEEKSLKSPQCCLPKLLSSRSFSERKKRMSPARG